MCPDVSSQWSAVYIKVSYIICGDGLLLSPSNFQGKMSFMGIFSKKGGSWYWAGFARSLELTFLSRNSWSQGGSVDSFFFPVVILVSEMKLIYIKPYH